MKWIDQFSDRVTRQEHILGIHCDVTDCAFHDDKGKCSANQVRVGPTYAENTEDTGCSTFRKK